MAILNQKFEYKYEKEIIDLDKYIPEFLNKRSKFVKSMDIARAIHYIKNSISDVELGKHFPTISSPTLMKRLLLNTLLYNNYIYEGNHLDEFLKVFKIDINIQPRKINEYQFTQRMPSAILSYVFTFLRPSKDVLNNCYRVNRCWSEIVALPTSCIYWNKWKQLDNLGALVPKWLSRLEKIEFQDEMQKNDKSTIKGYLNFLVNRPEKCRNLKYLSGNCDDVHNHLFIPLSNLKNSFSLSSIFFALKILNLDGKSSKFNFHKLQELLNEMKNNLEEVSLKNLEFHNDSTPMILVPFFLRVFKISISDSYHGGPLTKIVDIGENPNHKLESIHVEGMILNNLGNARNIKMVEIDLKDGYIDDFEYFVKNQISLTANVSWFYTDPIFALKYNQLEEKIDLQGYLWHFKMTTGSIYELPAVISPEISSGKNYIKAINLKNIDKNSIIESKTKNSDKTNNNNNSNSNFNFIWNDIAEIKMVCQSAEWGCIYFDPLLEYIVQEIPWLKKLEIGDANTFIPSLFDSSSKNFPVILNEELFRQYESRFGKQTKKLLSSLPNLKICFMHDSQI